MTRDTIGSLAVLGGVAAAVAVILLGRHEDTVDGGWGPGPDDSPPCGSCPGPGGTTIVLEQVTIEDLELVAVTSRN